MHLTGEFEGVGVAPSVVSAQQKGNIVYLTFSEALDEATATNPANYTISGGVTVTKAEFEPSSNKTKVGLTVTGYVGGTDYTVTVNLAVKDLAGNNITA